MIERLTKHQDLVLALNNHINSLESQNEFTCFENFIKVSCERLSSFIEVLDGEYIWLQETIALIKATQWYEKMLKETSMVLHPTFGTVDNYVNLLTDIYNKGKNNKTLYPEVSAIAGQSLINLLHTLLLIDPSSEYLQKIFTLGPEVSEFIIDCHETIKRKNPNSVFLDYEIPVLILTGLVQVCINNKKFELIEGILGKCEELGKKYDLAGILVTVYWSRFIFYQDYEALLKVYKLYPKIVFPRFVEPNDFEVLFRKMQAYISAGVFEEADKFKHYSDALIHSRNFPFSSNDSNPEDLMHQRMSEYIVQIFYFIEKAAVQETIPAIQQELMNAKPYAMAIESELYIKTDAVNIFSLKTFLILAILHKDSIKIQELVQKINSLPLKALTTDQFLVKAKETAAYIAENESKDPLNILDLPIEKRDPWSRLLEKIVQLYFKESLQNRLKFSSRAILLVEGPTEVNVIPVWAKTIGFDFRRLGIGIISLKGAPKANFHLRLWKEILDSAKLLTHKNNLTLYLILDLNAKSYGEEAVSQGLIAQTNCFILSLGDIEEYYPTEALKKTLENMCGKKPLDSELIGDRVHAIDHFLRKNGYYDDWKIRVGTQVAELTPSSEIPLEIQDIIRRIVNL